MMRYLLSFGSQTDFAISVKAPRASFSLRTLVGTAVCVAMLTGFAGQTVCAQDDAVADEEEVVDLGGEDISLKTKDGLRMQCRYYAGPEEKDTIPVVLLHNWKGQGSDFDELALFLQSDDGGGHSVIVPDLRGHGGSTELRPEGSEKSKELSSARMGKKEFMDVLQYDLEAIKTFLMEKHNQEALNIDALTIVGSDMGSVLALYWTARDWSWEPLAGIKQGQDVKAVILLSPPTSFKGVTPQVALKQPDLRDKVSLLIMYGGNDSKASSAATRLNNTLKRNRKQEFETTEEKREKQDLFLVGLDTSLQGIDLLADAELPSFKYISQFIQGRVRNHMEEDFPWKTRRRAN